MTEHRPYTARTDGFFPHLAALAGQGPARSGCEAPARPGCEAPACPDCEAPETAAPSAEDIRRALSKERLEAADFALLLSPVAATELESLARRASRETLRHFGRARQLFAPLYLGNYCTNKCVYCGFHAGQSIARKALSIQEIEAEAIALARTGLGRVLALTGDAPRRTGADYIAGAVAVLARHFPSVGIEVQALREEEYAQVARAGADSMTMFQETYDPVLYERLHPAGPKRDFSFRLDAPQRAAEAGMRGVTLGALLGLGDWRSDVFLLALHGQWLQSRYPHLELSFSLPRIRPCSEARQEGRGQEGMGRDGMGQGQDRQEGMRKSGPEQSAFQPVPVSDREFVQALTALRCFLPHAGITLSTRECAALRDNLLPLGVTRVSAGVCTSVGGYARQEERDPVQFVIDDQRSVDRMAEDMAGLGFQPVYADWLLPADGALPLADGLRRSLGGADVTACGRTA